MNRATIDRLPGVYFEVEPPAPSDPLPRMDIAAFVGFASSGPLHIPVAVEDLSRFRDIFGDDQALAWDQETSQTARANLGPSVEAFFRNGGRRCWGVRVADVETAESNRFPLAGLVQAAADITEIYPAAARARSAGSWSDTLRVEAVAAAGGTFSVYSFDDGAVTFDLTAPLGSIVKGDLLRVTFGDSGLLLFMVADTVERKRTAAGAGLRVKRSSGYWFLAAPRTELLDGPSAACIVGVDANTSLPLYPAAAGAVRLIDADAGRYQVELDVALADAPREGDLLRVDFTVGMETGYLLLPVTGVESRPEDSPPEDRVVVTGEGGLWGVPDPLTLLSAYANLTVTAERLAFDLWIWREQEVLATLRNLAFHHDHPRYWANLPTDEELFARNDGGAPTVLGPIAAEASSPRFPLAGPVLLDPDDDPPTFLPLGMPRAPRPDAARGPVDAHDPDSELRRNGLEQFGESLFLDPDLLDSGASTLVEDANYKLYIRRAPLTGLHSVLPIDEITLIALPDAVQRGWAWRTVIIPSQVVPAPELLLSYEPGDAAAILSWISTVDGSTYELRESGDPLFGSSITRYTGEKEEYSVPAGVECPSVLYYQVRIVRESLVSPWSNTAALWFQLSEFDLCGRVILGAPELSRSDLLSPPDDEIVVEWSAVAGVDSYVVQSATDPTFIDAVEYETPGTSVLVPWDHAGPIFIRVRGTVGATSGGTSGPWSNTEGYEPLPQRKLSVVDAVDYDASPLLAAHRALVRFCAARGDLLALLAMPAHFRRQESLAYLAMLTPDTSDDDAIETAEDSGAGLVRPLNPDEEIGLSYAALYHPWLAVRSNTARAGDSYRYIPPDGAVCGALAARTIARGAWIAPANDPLKGVIGLAPPIPRDARLDFYDASINLVRDDPRGYMLLSADTLSADDSLRPINVRRLMILLRRMALREGAAYVFESNNERFHRRVQVRFEELLGYLYQRGAFATGRPDSSFQVVTDGSVNLQSSLDQGRFIVELRVAPARPLEFITVRLVQSGNGGFTFEER